MARASLREEDEDRFAEGLPPLTPQMIEAAISPKRGSSTPRSPPETPERVAAQKPAEEAPGQSAGQNEESRGAEKKTADKSEGGPSADDAKAKIASAGSWFSQKMSELGGAATRNFDAMARRAEDEEADEDAPAPPPPKAAAAAAASASASASARWWEGATAMNP